MKGIVQGVIWLLLLALITAGILTLMVRPAAAAACPQCFGLVDTGDGIYVQSSMDGTQRTRVRATVTEALTRATVFYGALRHRPRILICADDACYHRLGGVPGTGVGSLGSFSLEVASQGVNPVYIAAGLSRAELQGRVGFWKFNLGAVPMWFDEGVAVVVADDPAYILPPGHGDRCKAGSFPDMPATPTEWQEELQQEGDMLYAQSACKTVMWMMEHGGPKAVTGLVDKVAQGQDFTQLFD
ncbi:MAG TPA: hypothetical protein VH327_05545 [Gammaproteobacteria bacterium]|nr:hypothetical protein [Gammaproteobacteria bacterium]